MTYRGHVENGAVVLDESVSLPEGAEVRVELLAEKGGEPTLREVLLKYAGKAKGLPTDAARNLDHYLYGAPKQ